MNMNRLANPMTVAAGLIFLCAIPGLTFGQNAAPSPAQTPKAASHATQPKKDSPPPDDFAGLDYTDEQKTEIDKIHRVKFLDFWKDADPGVPILKAAKAECAKLL